MICESSWNHVGLVHVNAVEIDCTEPEIWLSPAHRRRVEIDIVPSANTVHSSPVWWILTIRESVNWIWWTVHWICSRNDVNFNRSSVGWRYPDLRMSTVYLHSVTRWFWSCKKKRIKCENSWNHVMKSSIAIVLGSPQRYQVFLWTLYRIRFTAHRGPEHPRM